MSDIWLSTEEKLELIRYHGRKIAASSPGSFVSDSKEEIVGRAQSIILLAESITDQDWGSM